MRALATAVLYFGSFLLLGYGAKRLLAIWMDRHGASLDDVQAQAGDDGPEGRLVPPRRVAQVAIHAAAWQK